MFGALGAAAFEEVAFGSATLDASPGLAATMGAGFAIVAILLDQLVAHRSAVLAALLTGAIGAVPMIVTLGETNVIWFVLYGVMALLLFRYTARRHPDRLADRRPRSPSRSGPPRWSRPWPSHPRCRRDEHGRHRRRASRSTQSLRLGDDLRQPNPVELLTVAADGETRPYLRLTTLSRFDGRVWQPDRGDLQSQDDGFGAPEWGEEIATEGGEQPPSGWLRMSSSWLPVPYPATAVAGSERLVAGFSPTTARSSPRSADAVGQRLHRSPRPA